MNHDYFDIDRLYEKEMKILNKMNIFIANTIPIYQIFYDDGLVFKENEIISEYYYRLLAYEKENTMMLIYVHYHYANNGDSYDIIHSNFNELSENKLFIDESFKNQINMFKIWLETHQLDNVLNDTNSIKKLNDKTIKL